MIGDQALGEPLPLGGGAGSRPCRHIGEVGERLIRTGHGGRADIRFPGRLTGLSGTGIGDRFVFAQQRVLGALVPADRIHRIGHRGTTGKQRFESHDAGSSGHPDAIFPSTQPLTPAVHRGLPYPLPETAGEAGRSSA
jgi:hypothetical protein